MASVTPSKYSSSVLVTLSETAKLPDASDTRARDAVKLMLSCLLLDKSVICVWIALVTPSKYPSSVLVTLSETAKLPDASDTRARDAVKLMLSCLLFDKSVICVWIVTPKDASSFMAAAISFKVSSVPGALSTKLLTAVLTYAVVAICVVLVPAEAVGAVGVPVRAASAEVALVSSCVWIALVTPFKKSNSVLDTLPPAINFASTWLMDTSGLVMSEL